MSDSLITKLPQEIYDKIVRHLDYLEVIEINKVRSCDAKLLGDAYGNKLDAMSLKLIIQYDEQNKLDIPKTIFQQYIGGVFDVGPRIKFEKGFYRVEIASTNEKRSCTPKLKIPADRSWSKNIFTTYLVKNTSPVDLTTTDPNEISVKNKIDKIVTFRVLENVSFGKPENKDSIKFLKNLMNGHYGSKNKNRIESYFKKFLSDEASTEHVFEWLKKCFVSFVPEIVDPLNPKIEMAKALIDSIIRYKTFVNLISEFVPNDVIKRKIEKLIQNSKFQFRFRFRLSIREIIRFQELPGEAVKFLDRLIDEPFESCDWPAEFKREAWAFPAKWE